MKKRNAVSATQAARGQAVIDALTRRRAYGPDRAVHADVLCRDLGIWAHDGEAIGNGAQKTLRRRVGEARDSGFLVGSGGSGYYLPTTMSDVLHVIAMLEGRALTLLERAARLRESALARVSS